ncbi:ATPase [Candidatus Nomurabacteria bacterium]|nr:ATPase [Candidatus Nomurabacteria bacterium]
MKITKADGTTEAFRPNKLRNSLKKAGANRDEVEHIVKQVEDELFDGMTTQVIYARAFELLRSSESPTAAKYSLRRALFGLGPTGFPFEDFLARLFEIEGYKTRTRLTLKGKCAIHELDVAAYRPDHTFIAEAKFHARPGIKSDLQVVMYSYARKLDLENKAVCKDDTCGIIDFLVVTNTKFTSTAEKYATCVGLQLLGWDYPRTNNLQDRIEAAGLYPITVIQSLSSAQKAALLKRSVIVCRDLLERPQILRHLHLSQRKTEAVLSEARQLCGGS